MNYERTKFYRQCGWCFIALMMFGIYLIAASIAWGAEVKGPETFEPGALVTYTADIEGDWIIVPAKGVGAAKDSNRKNLYIAATVPGDYTLIFFAVEDGKPVITQMVFTVEGIQPAPNPEPAPKIHLSEAEAEAVSEAFQAVLEGIRAGNIRTPQGARATFKTSLVSKVGTPSEEMTVYLTKVETSVDLTSLEGIQAGFKNALEELNE